MSNKNKIIYSVIVVFFSMFLLLTLKNKTFLNKNFANYIQNNQAEVIQETIEPRKHKAYTSYAKSSNTNFQYWYFAELIKVIDGDTFDAKLNLGMDIWVNKRIRMAGINAPEMRDAPKGEQSRKFLNELLSNQMFIIKTASDNADAYGRVLATVFTFDGKTNINDMMVKNNQAVLY